MDRADEQHPIPKGISLYSQKSHLQLNDLLPRSKRKGRSEQHHDIPVLRKGWEGARRAQFFLGPGIFLLVAEWFYWHESESMWVICIINETTLFHSVWAHFIRAWESKENFCFLSGFPKMISCWWLPLPHQNSEFYKAMKLHTAGTASNPGRNVVAKHTGSCNDLPLPNVTFDNKSETLSLLS